MTIVASLKGVERVFDEKVQALGPIDLEIRDGEFLSLLGPSGCGKSTALRIIAGLLEPTIGKVEWRETKPRIGFVFQDPTLMPWATARDNVRLPLELERIARHETIERAEVSLARVGLSGFANAYPRTLSGGMRMRASIARALVAKPKLLLMDEPFAALDEISREALNEDLLKLWREDGLTIVFVTHSVYESTFLSSRIVTLTPRPGRIAGEFHLASPPDRSKEWRMSKEFGDAAREVSKLLRAGMATAA
ncbi:MAG TPA: ABC transporter ATP-binding protein [Micropepsaceae bacterium]|nr:ABC transporter ATP-binding protein [Micropepsaceae bacterium]